MTRLYRSNRDRVMTGLAGGLAENIGMDSTLLRILLLAAIVFTGGAVIPVYFIAALIIPREYYPGDPYAYGPGRSESFGGYPGGYPGGRPHGGPRGCGPRGPRGPQGPGAWDRGAGGYSQGAPGGYAATDSGLDEMMKDIEKKALRKEVEELKRKLAQYENPKGEV